MSTRAFPRGLIHAGWPFVAAATLLAFDLVYEQTFLTWERGPQMIGFSLMHSGVGALLILVVYAGLLWVAAVVVYAVLSRSFGGTLTLVLLACYGLAWVIMSIPYHWWQLQMVERLGPWPNGAKALHYADPAGVKLIKALIQKGYDVNYADEYNYTTLHASVVWGNPEIVALLLEHGARIDERAKLSGITPLLLAIRENRDAIAVLLLERGADPHQRDNDGNDAFALAKKGGNPMLMKQLERKQTPKSAKSNSSSSGRVASCACRRRST
jgi:hypothetical protein